MPNTTRAALFMASACETEAEEIAASRAKGDSWAAIIKAHEVKPGDLYFMISGKIESPCFAPIFAKFDSTSQDKWDNLIFEDDEIIDIVNLRFVSRHYDYSFWVLFYRRCRSYGLRRS